MTDRGLYPAPDEEPPVAVSAPAASLPRADAPEPELKPCPFCGDRAIITTLHTNNGRADNPSPYAYVVRCFVCEAQRLPAATPQIAMKEWNRRDGEDARIAEAVAQGAAEERRACCDLLRRNYSEYVESEHCDPAFAAGLNFAAGLLKDTDL